MKIKRGFLLIDAVFSIVFISILTLYFLPVLSSSLKNRNINSHKNMIIDEVEYVMEEITGKVYSGYKLKKSGNYSFKDDVAVDYTYLGNNLYKITVYSKEFKDEIRLYTILEEKRINSY